MLAMLSRRFRVDRVHIVTVTQQTLLAVSLEGYSYNQMIAFKEKVEYILNGMPPDSWPADSTLFSWFYCKIKASRGMQRIIDKIKDSSPASNMRTFAWLWEQFSDYLAELREDQNERDFREAMMKETKTDTRPAKEKVKATAAAAAKAAAAAAVPPKKKASPQPPPPPPKREGKGDGGKGQGKGNDKGKGKGADCPFSHEAAPANTAKKGSGRSLASIEALKAQGIFLDERSMGEIVDSGSRDPDPHPEEPPPLPPPSKDPSDADKEQADDEGEEEEEPLSKEQRRLGLMQFGFLRVLTFGFRFPVLHTASCSP
ncbi:hypothetical protein AK812_SmicGene17051 [Symbiodinium microadriaticum]|uniref:Uncharacterized protein n=1 Tax=Symbiodinium microadriaticum TaxID=2951 RepID=A0A1Q9DYQ0_SYMMI|nr:hypothetical protein AK812_SmicGene17051 [Symbiodinium microadriaticum]